LTHPAQIVALLPKCRRINIMRKGQNWTPIYLVIIIAIAVILIFTIIKPMFSQAGQYVQQTLPALLR